MADDGANSRVSSSKRLMMADDDGNNNRSSSVHQVLFNGDLLAEILLRLPVIFLFYCKSVSKSWLSVITSPDFIQRVNRFPNIHPTCGLFVQEINSTTRGYFQNDFVSLDSRIPQPGKKKKSSAFPFGCFGSNASDVEVLQSCNGLVLCVIRTNPADDNIYVCNPSVNMSNMLPQVDGLKISRLFDQLRLAFDPTKSPHYKLLHIRVIDPHRRPRPQSIQPRIYSSETSSWRIVSNTFPYTWFSGDFDRGVYWNDAIHWLDLRSNQVRHFKLDVEDQNITTTQLPETLDWNCYKELFESRGCLLLACAGDPHPKQLEIYEMGNGYSGWSLKYNVDYEDNSIAAFFKTWNMSTVGFRFNVLHIVVGERQEESFVVMKLYGKVVKYNLLLKTLHVLYDMDTHSTNFRAFPFIASFAGV